MSAGSHRPSSTARPGRRGSARLRLALSYAIFLVAAGAIVLAGVYVVLRTVPNYPLTPANPRDESSAPSRQEILELLLGTSAYIIAALAVIGIVGGWLVAGWILRPLKDLDEAAVRAANGDLTHRIRLGRDDEFGRLANTFDDMLDRLHTAFAAQERFAANASHELRTPLAVTAAMLEVARRDDSHDHEELLRRLTATNERAIGLTEALLQLADIMAANVESSPVDLRAAVAQTVDEASEEAHRRSVEIVSQLDPATALGDEALLRQLATNLVQNAVRHNLVASPTVWVRTGADSRGMCTLTVENTGELISRDAADRLTEPFLRGSGRTIRPGSRASERGYGLGLALVARVVEVHRGTLRIEPRTGGGLVVSVTLPGG